MTTVGQKSVTSATAAQCQVSAQPQRAVTVVTNRSRGLGGWANAESPGYRRFDTRRSRRGAAVGKPAPATRRDDYDVCAGTARLVRRPLHPVGRPNLHGGRAERSRG